MTGLVTNISRVSYAGVASVGTSASAAYRRLGLKNPTREMLVLCSLMMFLQVADGILTGIGVNYFGTQIEGNLFLRSLMEQWGFVQALISVKTLAILIVIALGMLSTVVEWLPRAMKTMIMIYMVAAIIPWTVILCTRIL